VVSGSEFRVPSSGFVVSGSWFGFVVSGFWFLVCGFEAAGYQGV